MWRLWFMWTGSKAIGKQSLSRCFAFSISSANVMFHVSLRNKNCRPASGSVYSKEDLSNLVSRWKEKSFFVGRNYEQQPFFLPYILTFLFQTQWMTKKNKKKKECLWSLFFYQSRCEIEGVVESCNHKRCSQAQFQHFFSVKFEHLRNRT